MQTSQKYLLMERKNERFYLLVNLQTKETNDPDWPLLNALDFIKHSDVI